MCLEDVRDELLIILGKGRAKVEEKIEWPMSGEKIDSGKGLQKKGKKEGHYHQMVLVTK